ncbi:MAG: glycosyl-4,4'-diaponeurosporenoate acyltransferase [Eubacteriales bacterium]|nr:glycosyl-4,4'-diaponeurosporenoate acyltransferase [Eubacteriales bacterium]
MGFLRCFCYLCALGVCSFFLGRLVSFCSFAADRIPFRTYPFEKKLYQRLHVRRWQGHVPDMSRIAKRLMPQKNLSGDYRSRLSCMIQETCVAELIHVLLCVLGFGCCFLWRGGGLCIALLYFLGNLPFVFIQRYNRPMLQLLAQSSHHGARKES